MDSIIVTLNNSNCKVTNNNQFIYTFPIPFTASNDLEICLASGFIYNSLFNVVNNVYNNASYSIIFPTSIGGQELYINMPDGFYDVDTGINGYLQKKCVESGYYLIDSTGANVYYASFNSNIIYYSVTFTATPVPTTLPTGWSYPPNGWGNVTNNLPASSVTPQLVVPNNGFSTLIGYVPGTYPTTPSSILYNTDGTLTPILSPQYVYNINVNMVNTVLYNSSPNSVYQFTWGNTGFGSQQILAPYQYQWYSVQQNTYNQIILTLTDQANNPLLLKDSNSQFTLFIRRKQKN